MLDNGVKVALQDPVEILENVTILDEGIPESTQNVEETVEIYTIIDEGILETVNSEEIADLPIIISDDFQGIALHPTEQNAMTVVENTNSYIKSTVQDSKELLEPAVINDESIQKCTPYLDKMVENVKILDDEVVQCSVAQHPYQIINTDAVIEQNLQNNVPLTHAEIIRNATIIDDGIKLCPLCRNEVRLFYVNFNEKILMCENIDCDYPFGYEDIIIVNNEDELASVTSMPTCGTQTALPSVAASVISSAAWAEVDKMNSINDNEAKNNPKPEVREYFKHRRFVKKNKQTKFEENAKIMKKVEAIKVINEEMQPPSDPCIKNEKWIKNLLKMQQSSGISLLKPEEISMFKQKKPDFGLGELKIDINRDSEEESAIKIQISNLHSDES